MHFMSIVFSCENVMNNLFNREMTGTVQLLTMSYNCGANFVAAMLEQCVRATLVTSDQSFITQFCFSEHIIVHPEVVGMGSTALAIVSFSCEYRRANVALFPKLCSRCSTNCISMQHCPYNKTILQNKTQCCSN